MKRESTILQEIIKRYAHHHGITQADVAESLGMTEATLSRKLSGSRCISFGEARRMAKLLGVSMETLWEVTHI